MAHSFIYDNKIVSIGGSISADSEDPLYPATNLKDFNSATVWRSVDAAGAYHIVHDFGSATSISATALANVNFSTTASVHIQASTTSNFAVLNVDETINVSAISPFLGKFNLYHKLASVYSYRYWRLEIDDSSGSVDGFYEVGEWYLSSVLNAPNNQDPEYPFTVAYPDNNILHETEYMTQYSYIRDVEKLRKFTLEYKAVSTQMKNQLLTVYGTVLGSGYPFFISLIETTSPFDGIFVKITGGLEIAQEKTSLWTMRISLQEQARGLALPTVEF